MLCWKLQDVIPIALIKSRCWKILTYGEMSFMRIENINVEKLNLSKSAQISLTFKAVLNEFKEVHFFKSLRC